MSGEVQFARYRDNEGARCCLYTEGRKNLTAVWFDGGVAVHTIPAAEVSRMQPVFDEKSKKATAQGRVVQAARFLLSAGKRYGITKGAQEFLKEIVDLNKQAKRPAFLD